jgi:hypothetical protein
LSSTYIRDLQIVFLIIFFYVFTSSMSSFQLDSRIR